MKFALLRVPWEIWDPFDPDIKYHPSLEFVIHWHRYGIILRNWHLFILAPDPLGFLIVQLWRVHDLRLGYVCIFQLIHVKLDHLQELLLFDINDRQKYLKSIRRLNQKNQLVHFKFFKLLINRIELELALIVAVFLLYFQMESIMVFDCFEVLNVLFDCQIFDFFLI